MNLALFRSYPGFIRSLLSLALLTGVLSAQTLNPAFVEHYTTSMAGFPIAKGIDGAMWWCGYPMGAINPLGQIKILQNLYCNGIAEGPDGAMWFTMYGGQYPNRSVPVIGRITASGVVTGYPVPLTGQPDGAQVEGITAGPDGALWFTDRDQSGQGFDQIGRITVSGEITMYPLPTLGSDPLAITAGSDGNLWFTETGGIGRITPTGVTTEFPISGDKFPGNDSLSITDITSGPDGALWVTAGYNHNESYGAIVRVTTGGSITVYNLLTNGYTPNATTSGPNNLLWFFTGGTLNSISTDGNFTYYSVSSSGGAGAIATAADGSLWFSEEYGIGQVIMQTATLTALPANPTSSGAAYPGSSLTMTGSGYAPGETVNLNSNSTGANQLGTATADSGGTFSVSVKVPELAISELTISGPQVVPWQTVVGVGATSGKIAVARYTVAPLLWPSSTVVSPGSSITVSGFGFGQYELLTMYWNTEADEIWQGHCGKHGAFYGTTAVTFTIPENTAPGTYELWVTGGPYPGSTVSRYITVQ